MLALAPDFVGRCRERHYEYAIIQKHSYLPESKLRRLQSYRRLDHCSDGRIDVYNGIFSQAKNGSMRYIKMYHRVFLSLMFNILLSITAYAQAIEMQLYGELIQGGLAHGATRPDAKVFLNGERLTLSRNGRFVFGFGRDAPAQAILRVSRGQDTTRRILEVRRREYTMQRVDGLPPQMVTPPAGVSERIREEAKLIRQARMRRSFPDGIPLRFIWPVHGTITGVYGSRRILNGAPRQPHFGVDIACPTGTVVRAPADGVVTLARPDMYFTGMTMVLVHGYGISSTLLHLSEMLVAEGDAFKQGDAIAKVGSTGRSTGAHLDWRINWLNARLDPALLAGEMLGDKLCM